MITMKVVLIFGTRPEIIKMASTVRELIKKNIKPILIHTGQHYDYELSLTFLKSLNLPKPKYQLEIGSGTHAQQTAKSLNGIEEILNEIIPNFVLVQGDTNTTLAGALAAKKLHIPVCHIEAGLRSFDIRMPEETNRILTDHCSNFLYPPTESAALNLLNEGFSPKKITITGNTIVDACLQNKEYTNNKILKKNKLKPKNYFLLTLHRPETVDIKSNLSEIIKTLNEISKESIIIFPIHPRTKSKIKKFNLKNKFSDNIKIIKPTNYLDFLSLLVNSKAVFTDSGGIQEEACILKISCFTLRDNTERPETIDIGANKLLGTNYKEIIKKWSEIDLDKFRKNIDNSKNPFGDGKASEKIVNSLTKNKNFKIEKDFLDKNNHILRSLIIDSTLENKTVKEIEFGKNITILKVYNPSLIYPHPNLKLKSSDICIIQKK